VAGQCAGIPPPPPGAEESPGRKAGTALHEVQWQQVAAHPRQTAACRRQRRAGGSPAGGRQPQIFPPRMAPGRAGVSGSVGTHQQCAQPMAAPAKTAADGTVSVVAGTGNARGRYAL